LLAEADNPAEAIAGIVHEMEEGRAGAQRSMKTAAGNEERIAGEIAEEQTQVDKWTADAREKLQQGEEDQARLALVRKQEATALLAGLVQQHEAAVATREHMTTTLRVLEARLADARRRQQELDAGGSPAESTESAAALGSPNFESFPPSDSVEAELAALKKELGQGG
jgi:phage shock protein A